MDDHQKGQNLFKHYFYKVRDRLKIQKPPGLTWWEIFRAILSFSFFLLFLYFAAYFRTCTYLLRQASGQLHILLHSKPVTLREDLSERARSNLLLLDSLKRFSVDSLAYESTENYTTLYNHGSEPVLWVVTASQPYSLEPRYWSFPIVGKVSYKGFFDKELAAAEYASLQNEDLDVEISPVTAYSTLGWFRDPVFSGMLERSKGAFCNLILHELFHATYYAPGKVNLNENLANFFAHKATLKFLSSDTAALRAYVSLQHDRKILREFLQREALKLQTLYDRIYTDPDKHLIKERFFRKLTDSLRQLPLSVPERAAVRAKEINAARNAFFVGYTQYESLQDSLENVFNKIYKGNIQNMVRDLKPR